MTRYRRQARVQDHYTQIPHGLWTAPLSYGAKVLLGWLHSHDAPYLARLTNNRIREELGASGQVGGWIKELVAAGFLAVEKRGQANQFILLAEPWEALADRRINQPGIGQSDDEEPADYRSEPTDYRSVTSRKTVGNQPKNGHIEEQVEEHVEQQVRKTNTPISDMPRESLELVIVEADTTLTFADFWALYPRKDAKADAAKVWKRMKPTEHQAAVDALPDHVELWRHENRANQYLPQARTWLNQRRWEDELPEHTPQGLGPSRAQITIQEMMKHAAIRESQDRGLPRRAVSGLD